MSTRTPRAVVALLAVAGLALTGCATDSLAARYGDGGGQNYLSGDGSTLEIAAENRGEPVSYAGPGIDGGEISSADQAGEVHVVNFWFAACAPCRIEAPVLEEVAQEYAPQGVDFVGVNTYDAAGSAQAFNTDKGVTYPSILDAADNAVQLAFAQDVPPNAIPTTLVIDREGRVAARISGRVEDASILSSMIDRVLAEGA
jgi:thiol-disulfide isomerase/thioredoxin